MTILLDKTIIEEVERLSEAERSSYAFEHYILIYGIKSVSHVNIMSEALKVCNGEIPLKDFIRKYDIDFRKFGDLVNMSRWPSTPLRTVEADGVYVPVTSYAFRDRSSPERFEYLFEPDLGQFFRSGDNSYGEVRSKEDYERAREFMLRDWSIEDFEDSEIVKEGVKLSRRMWRCCVVGFEKAKESRPNGVRRVDGKSEILSWTVPQQQNVTELGRKLIDYYSSLINDWTREFN